jgi:DNA-binding NarL/FixJ family response regulator
MASLRILIADDHETVRRGLRSLLSLRPEWEICGEAVDSNDALQKVKDLKPQVAVIDISMPQLNGLEATRQIRKEVPETEVLIVSQHESAEVVAAAMDAGARGYVVKTDVPRDFLAAIEAVGHCRPAFSSRIAHDPANLFACSIDSSRDSVLQTSGTADPKLNSIFGSGEDTLVGVRDRLIFQQNAQRCGCLMRTLFNSSTSTRRRFATTGTRARNLSE